MIEYITKEQARDALLYLDDDLAFVPEDRIEEISNAWNDEIRRLPAADVVEVVRCKNCKHYIDNLDYGTCTRWYNEKVEENYFCGEGKRKEGENNG